MLVAFDVAAIGISTETSGHQGADFQLRRVLLSVPVGK